MEEEGKEPWKKRAMTGIFVRGFVDPVTIQFVSLEPPSQARTNPLAFRLVFQTLLNQLLSF